MQNTQVYTDGACSGNPGVGGWAAVIVSASGEPTEICGSDAQTTNNRMELQAVIEALKFLTNTVSIDLHTDSMYVKNGITTWIKKWKLNGWKTASKTPVKNQELWLQLDELVDAHKVSWYWVKGHSGDEYNERADLLARQQVTHLSAKRLILF